jgi:hypothetical protein
VLDRAAGWLLFTWRPEAGRIAFTIGSPSMGIVAAFEPTFAVDGFVLPIPEEAGRRAVNIALGVIGSPSPGSVVAFAPVPTAGCVLFTAEGDTGRRDVTIAIDANAVPASGVVATGDPATLGVARIPTPEEPATPPACVTICEELEPDPLPCPMEWPPEPPFPPPPLPPPPPIPVCGVPACGKDKPESCPGMKPMPPDNSPFGR